jgi:putative phage-type endonuclease
MEQRTDEWKQARVGKVTASRVADIISKTKSGYSASRENYLYELLAERLTGQPYGTGYTSSAMQWGTEQEMFARGVYEMKTGEMVQEVGFIEHPDIPMFGASPDGLVGADGMVEIKCPETKTHLQYYSSKIIPKKYKTQMTVQMMCTGRIWCDFASYDPRLPDNLQMVIIPYGLDEEFALEIRAEVKRFLRELETLEEKYRGEK